VKKWIEKIKEFSVKANPVIMILGNKYDHSEKEVSNADIEELKILYDNEPNLFINSASARIGY
jgi:hypothetical protein